MNEYLIPALTVAPPSIGFIAGALFAGGRAQEKIERLGASIEREDIRLRYVTLAAEWMA